jgi:F-type H+-transporting ATPase subunit b
MADLFILAAGAHSVATEGLHNDTAGDGLASGVAAPEEAHHAPDPTALGLNSTGWVGLAALVVLIGMVAVKVPGKIAAMLDKNIAGIRDQLNEAAALRRDAEALKAEYEAKAAAAQADAEATRANAHAEAQAIVAKAKVDAEDLMARRTRMAEDKIAAAERAAIAEVRAKTAAAATAAAATLIAGAHDADADRALVNKAIGGIGRLN